MDIHQRIYGITCTKDPNSVITSCNDVFLEYLGVASDEQVIGRTDYELHWQERADLYRQHELDAFSGNHYSAIIPIKLKNGDDVLFMHTKTQQVDENAKPIGINCHSVEIINPNANYLFNLLINNNPKENDIFYLNKNYEKYHLTRREKDILFFVSKGKTAKTIAQVLNLSMRTVNSHIERLKLKLCCRTKSELADVAFDEGFSQLLPKVSLNSFLSGMRDS